MERRRSLLEHEDDIVEVLEYSSDSDNDQYDSPRLLEHGPKTKYPKEHRSKSRGRKDKNKKRKSSLFSDDSSSEDDFTQGFKAGRMASLPRRPASRRGRSGSRLFDLSDDSFEDLEPRRRSRSKSRGPRNRKSTSGGRRR